MRKNRHLFNLIVNENLEKAVEKSVNDTELNFNVGQEKLEKADDNAPKLNDDELEKLLCVIIKDSANFKRNSLLNESKAYELNPNGIVQAESMPIESDEDYDLACAVYEDLIRRMAYDKNLHAAIRACEMDKEYVSDVLEGKEPEEMEKSNLEDKPADKQQDVQKTLEQELDELMICLKADSEPTPESK